MFNIFVKNINVTINEYIRCEDMSVKDLKDLIAEKINSYECLFLLSANKKLMNNEDMISVTIKENIDTNVYIKFRLNPKKVVIDKLSEWFHYWNKTLVDKKVLYEKEGLEEYYIEDDVILETIPEYICVLEDLEEIQCQDFGVKTIPNCLNKLINLQSLTLSHNKIEKININSIVNLTWLDLAFNLLKEFPEIWNLTNLEWLFLGNNNLSGKIPSNIGKLKKLKKLHLEKNNLSGNIPEEIYDLSKLESLTVQNNKLTGKISPKIGNLKNLYAVEFSNNYLTGQLPSELASLTNLLYFHSFFNNNFSEDIPDEIKKMKKYKKTIKIFGSIFTKPDSYW